MIRRMLLIAIVPISVAAQSSDSTKTSGSVSVFSDPPGAEVMVGDSLVGRTPLIARDMAAGLHEIRIAAPSFRDWSAMIRKESLNLQAGESLSVSYDLGSVIRVITDPAGVEVLHAGRFLGTTPLVHHSERELTDQIVLRKEGYHQQVLPPSSLRGIITLKAADAGLKDSEMAVEWSEENGRQHLGEYISAAGIVVSGVAAAYFKHQANKHFEAYRLTGNPADLDETKKLDAYSAVFLVLTQISVGMLTYLLLGAQ